MIALLFMIEVHIRKIVDSHLRIVQSFAVGNRTSDPFEVSKVGTVGKHAVAGVVADERHNGPGVEKLLTPAKVADSLSC